MLFSFFSPVSRENDKTDDKKTIKEAFDPALMEQFLTAMAGPPAGAVGNPKIKLIGEVLGQRIYLEQQQLHDKARLSVFQIADPKLCDIFYEYWTAGPHLKGKMLVEDLEKSKQQLSAPIDKQRKDLR